MAANMPLSMDSCMAATLVVPNGSDPKKLTMSPARNTFKKRGIG
jgi:hypothetical protein